MNKVIFNKNINTLLLSNHCNSALAEKRSCCSQVKHFSAESQIYMYVDNLFQIYDTSHCFRLESQTAPILYHIRCQFFMSDCHEGDVAVPDRVTAAVCLLYVLNIKRFRHTVVLHPYCGV